MPNFNPVQPGDNVYPKYAITTTKTISAAFQIVKGVMYTTDGNGNLIEVTTDFSRGFFQAMETPAAISGAAGDDLVQVFGPRTRMAFPTQEANMSVGQDVIYDIGNDNVIAGLKTDVLYLGKIFEITNLQADNITQKHLTEVGDVVLVDTVGT